MRDRKGGDDYGSLHESAEWAGRLEWKRRPESVAMRNKRSRQGLKGTRREVRGQQMVCSGVAASDGEGCSVRWQV